MQNGCCKRHGGRNLRGTASTAYRGKNYSKYLPQRMLADYEELQDDPTRLSLQREIDILRLQLGDVLRQMYEADATFAVDAVKGAAQQIQAAYRTVQVAQRMGSAEKMAEGLTAWGHAIEHLFETLDPAVAQEEGRRRAVSMSLALDRLLRTENTVRLAERGMVTLEAVMARDRALVDAWKEALDAKVRDMAIRTAVLGEVARLYAEFVGRRTPATLNPAGPTLDIDVESAEATDG